MIRKISTQDVVSKNSSKSDEPTRRERDFLIERLSRKHNTASIADSPAKLKKHHKKNFNLGKKWIWFCIPILLIAVLFLVMQFLVSASVTVTPKKTILQIDSKLTALFDATTTPDALTYQIITLSAKESEISTSTGTVASKPTKASGQITIFNNYSSASQTLVKNTRFQTPDGLIYRIQNTINVPGTHVVNGKSVPGSLSVTVFADQTGSKYNIDLVDFTIPGFANDANRFAKIFARSKTAMIGGADENSFGVSPSDRQIAQDKMEARLKQQLLRQVQAQKTVNSVIFDSASKISFTHLADSAGSDAQHVVLNEQGTISSVVFDKKAVSKILAGNSLDLVGARAGNSAEIRGLESLHFISTASSTSTWPTKTITFTLSGPIDLVGVVDTNKFAQDIKGISKSDLQNVVVNFPTIDNVKVSLKPFWKTSLPLEASKIKIEVAN